MTFSFKSCIDEVMTEMTPNYHANHGYSTAEAIIRDISAYLANPTELSDHGRDFSLLVEKAHMVSLAMHEGRQHLQIHTRN
jgi:hypothetical protein